MTLSCFTCQWIVLIFSHFPYVWLAHFYIKARDNNPGRCELETLKPSYDFFILIASCCYIMTCLKIQFECTKELQ